MSNVIETRMAKLMSEATYRYGDDIISIVDFLRETLRKAIWTANAQFDKGVRKAYILLGLAIGATIRDLEPYCEIMAS